MEAHWTAEMEANKTKMDSRLAAEMDAKKAKLDSQWKADAKARQAAMEAQWQAEMEPALRHKVERDVLLGVVQMLTTELAEHLKTNAMREMFGVAAQAQPVESDVGHDSNDLQGTYVIPSTDVNRD